MQNGLLRGIIVDVGALNFLYFLVLVEFYGNEMTMVDIWPNDMVSLPYSFGIIELPNGIMFMQKALSSSIMHQLDGKNLNLSLQFKEVVLCVLLCFGFVLSILCFYIQSE